MGAAEYERAIVAMESLMSARSPEAAYQRLFEESSEILTSMGYSEWIPQPRLPLADGRSFVPDFLARVGSGAWEILDLKTPSSRVLRGRERREAFTAEMNSYIGQMHDYAEWFDDSANRGHVSRTYGIDVPPRPRSLLIAGREGEVNKVELHRQLRRIDAVAITTFDDVLRGLELEHARHYGAFERTYGLTVALVVSIPHSAAPTPTQLWRVGTAGLTTVQLSVNAHEQLVLTVHAAGSEPVVVTTSRGAFTPDTWMLVMTELAFDGRQYRLQLRINDAVVASLTLTTTDVLLLVTRDMTVGDPDPASRPITIFENVGWPTALGFRERLEYVNELVNTLEAPTGPYLLFGEGRHMTSSHQNPNLTSPDPASQPIIRLS